MATYYSIPSDVDQRTFLYHLTEYKYGIILVKTKLKEKSYEKYKNRDIEQLFQ